MLVSVMHAGSAAQGGVQAHQAQKGETPWVGASCVPPGPKSVNSGMLFRAELLRSSCSKECNDRIDGGTHPMYGLWWRYVAQSGAHSWHSHGERCAPMTALRTCRNINFVQE